MLYIIILVILIILIRRVKVNTTNISTGFLYLTHSPYQALFLNKLLLLLLQVDVFITFYVHSI